MNGKVVLDTNILVSALWSSLGNPFKIIDYLLSRKLTIFYSSEIMDEYQIVLSRPRFKFTKDEIGRILQIIDRYGIEIHVQKSNIPLPDESDRVFYDVARISGAYLVTGNIKHYPVEPWIVTPAVFVTLFEGQ